MAKKDFLDELMSARQAKNPAFRAMVDAARDRRRMLRRLAEARERLGLTQTQIAAAMGTSQSSVARIEAGKGDVKLSTVERYAATLGRKVRWSLSRPDQRSKVSTRRHAKKSSTVSTPAAATAKRR
jgi:transcriptional regulator with XRE-family HTH domain